MSSTNRSRTTLLAFVMGFALLAVALLALFATGAQAATNKTGANGVAGSVVTAPEPSRTPRPIRLRPWLQFGHARPGGTATYHKLLFNHLADHTMVDLGGQSLRGWDVDVVPTTTTTLPGYANVITVTVGVPMTPAHRIDLERVRAIISGTEPYTSTAYLLTITRRVPFTDLQEGNWADDPVQYLVDLGAISGYADGSFRPNENVTRAQFAKMLVTAMGWTVQTPSSPTFGDVPSSYWAYGYIETAAAHGVISGYADGSFRPGQVVTRGQVAKMVFTARQWALESPTMTNFSDVHPGDWFYDYVQAASSAEVMSGYGDNTFRPGVAATRAQIAKILAFALFSDPNS